MRTPFALSLCSALLFLAAPARAETPGEECCELDLWTGQGVSIGPIIPEVSFLSAFGGSTAEEGELAAGHHDPDRDGFTIQAVELALSARLGANAFVFANYSAKVDLQDDWADSFEEYYFSVGGLFWDARVKAGRFYTHFGYQNRLHAHDFTFVDQYLANGRLLGEDSNAVYGAEIALPVLRGLPSSWSDRLTVSFGAVPDPEEEGHEHGQESAFEGEGAYFQDYLATGDYRLTFQASESTQHQIGLSAAWGKNNFEEHTQVYGLHYEYYWRPAHHHEGKRVIDHKGHTHPAEHAPASAHVHGESGEFFRWRTEAIVRYFDAVSSRHEDHEEAGEAHEEEHEEGEAATEKRRRRDFSDAGFYTAATYGFPNGRVQAHLRAEYVSGISEAGLSERWRVSPALTWRPSDRLPLHFKLQYNYDHSPSFGDEHSVWAQLNFTWGDCCAHEH